MLLNKSELLILYTTGDGCLNEYAALVQWQWQVRVRQMKKKLSRCHYCQPPTPLWLHA